MMVVASCCRNAVFNQSLKSWSELIDGAKYRIILQVLVRGCNRLDTVVDIQSSNGKVHIKLSWFTYYGSHTTGSTRAAFSGTNMSAEAMCLVVCVCERFPKTPKDIFTASNTSFICLGSILNC